MRVDSYFIEKCINELQELTEKDRPYTRLVFSKEFLEARNWLTDRFKELELDIKVDKAGNLIGIYRSYNNSNKKVFIGSHLDTVPFGGRFDGIAGVVSSLSIIKSFRENNVEFPFDIELYDYLGEELNDWGMSCIGSRGMTGFLTEEILNRKNSSGKILKEEINKIGGDSNCLGKKFSIFQDIIACFELHIEQGVRLQNQNVEIGIVKSMPNISRHRIKVFGQASHSGTTLMQDRKDAILPASDLILYINKQAKKYSEKDNRHFVATVGKLDIVPNSATIIPSKVELLIDLRVVNKGSRTNFLKELNSEVTRLNNLYNQKIILEDVVFAPYVEMNSEVNLLLESSAKKLNLSYMYMDSGAGHDTAHLSRVAPASMIFIPCKDGLSHCPEEFAKIEDIKKGSQIIQQAILSIKNKMT